MRLEVPVQVTGFGEAPLVELYLDDATNQALKRGQQMVELTTEGLGQATFELGDLPLGTHQGYVQLAASDPLVIDNTRYFTVEVRPPAEVLLLGKQPSDTLFLREALSQHAALRAHFVWQTDNIGCRDDSVKRVLRELSAQNQDLIRYW